ncbi:MAG: DUF3515 family protein [Candidatus Nanopelagicales bacterium]
MRRVLALVGAALVLAGCSRGVPVPPPEPPPEGVAAYACAQMKGLLPALVLGHPTTATTPTSTNTQAWGDPAIVLRCGVGVPAALTPTSQLITVNGIDWLPEQLERGYLFTTVGRTPVVEVSVPDAYTPESDALVDLSRAVSTLPVATPSPSPSSS